MNRTQRLLVVASLVVVGLVLASLMLEWSDQWSAGRGASRVLFFYERPSSDPRFPLVTEEMGIYTRYGIAGILLGVIAPLCLFAAAAFVYLGTRKGI